MKLPRWGMVIDLRKCIGCGACVVACAEANKINPNLWRRVFDCGISRSPMRQRLYLPLNCMHCDDPPCEKVCPTTATYRRPDGIVDIDLDKCIGCGYCIVACPYHARAIIFLNEYNIENRVMGACNELSAAMPDYLGVCTKCNFCNARLDAGIEKGLKPGEDSEASPACVVHCTAEALHFGDLNDSKSQVTRLVRENKTFCLREDLGTHPRVYYIVNPNLIEENDF
jgi:phenylacetyl-CoA:acceptor oxidoreductase subunit 1